MGKKILDVLGKIFIAILLIILVLNSIIVIKSFKNKDEIPSLFGYKPFIVMSGSMETNISVGDLVVVKEENYDNLKVGDIIAFRDGEIVTTHRIVEKVNSCFKTKGDANNIEDAGTVCTKDIEGKYQFKIEGIGKTILFIQEPLGFTIMILSIIIIGMVLYFIENFGNKSKIEFVSEEEKEEFEEFKKKHKK